MPDLDLHRSLSEIAYAAGVASHPERAKEIRVAATRRRRRRTALVAAGSAVVVGATAVGALALSPIGDESTQPVTPPSTDSSTVTPPSETPTPTETPSPQVTGLAADPFLPDSEVHSRFGAQYGAGVGFDEPEWECTFPGLDATDARDLGLARWQEQPAGGSLSEYVLQFDSPDAADAAVSMTGDAWEMCRMPTSEFGGELAGPTALSVRDEAFRYTADIAQTADVVAQHQEVAIGRRGNVVVLLDIIWVGTTPPDSSQGLLDGLLPSALEYAIGTVTASSAPPEQDPGWLRSTDLPASPGIQWNDGAVTARRSDFGFTACDQDLLPSANGVTRQDEKSFGDESAIANQAQLIFDGEASARAYLTSFGRLYDECSRAQADEVTVRAIDSGGMSVAAWVLQLSSGDPTTGLWIYYGIAREGSAVTVIELVAPAALADAGSAGQAVVDSQFLALTEVARQRLADR